jgi:hypothetical protein
MSKLKTFYKKGIKVASRPAKTSQLPTHGEKHGEKHVTLTLQSVAGQG